jgi:hypothetical protein
MIVDWISRWAWGTHERSANKLVQFAQAELGSMLTLRLAANHTASDERRTHFLRHAIDEQNHARIFMAAAHVQLRKANENRAGKPLLVLPKLHADAEDLWRDLGEIRFLAFLHHAERRGRKRFQLYARMFEQWGDKKRQALFERILRDEQRHESDAWGDLVAMCGSESKAKREVMLARAWEAWRAWRRIGRSIAERVYYVLMLVLYLFVFPIALYVRWRKPSATRWQQAGLELSPLPAVPLLDPPAPAVPRSSQSLRY